jgi:hypothetical protein
MRIFFGDSILAAGRDPDRQDTRGRERAYPWPIFVALFFSRSETLERRLCSGDRRSDLRGWAYAVDMVVLRIASAFLVRLWSTEVPSLTLASSRRNASAWLAWTSALRSKPAAESCATCAGS